MAQEFFLQLGGVVHVEKHLILVLQVPLVVLTDVCHVVRVYVADEVKAVLLKLRWIVGEVKTRLPTGVVFHDERCLTFSLTVLSGEP